VPHDGVPDVWVTGLRKIYGDASVDAIGLDIAPGESVTTLGPSGSGKTTTLSSRDQPAVAIRVPTGQLTPVPPSPQ
jgi:ABC-type phosphate/phosphonate transport system ATPase subunit